MLKYGLSCLILLLVTPLAVTLAADSKNTPLAIVWEKTLDDAVTKAKTTEKAIL